MSKKLLPIALLLMLVVSKSTFANGKNDGKDDGKDDDKGIRESRGEEEKTERNEDKVELTSAREAALAVVGEHGEARNSTGVSLQAAMKPLIETRRWQVEAVGVLEDKDDTVEIEAINADVELLNGDENSEGEGVDKEWVMPKDESERHKDEAESLKADLEEKSEYVKELGAVEILADLQVEAGGVLEDKDDTGEIEAINADVELLNGDENSEGEGVDKEWVMPKDELKSHKDEAESWKADLEEKSEYVKESEAVEISVDLKSDHKESRGVIKVLKAGMRKVTEKKVACERSALDEREKTSLEDVGTEKKVACEQSVLDEREKSYSEGVGTEKTTADVDAAEGRMMEWKRITDEIVAQKEVILAHNANLIKKFDTAIASGDADLAAQLKTEIDLTREIFENIEWRC